MKPSILIGCIFGIISCVFNIFLALKIEDKSIGIILISGLLFFNTLFSTLITKYRQDYELTWVEGMKASIQSGIVQSIFYFLSIVLIQLKFKPDYFPGLDSIGRYLFYFNIYIIAFSFFSAIFGLITSTLLHNKK